MTRNIQEEPYTSYDLGWPIVCYVIMGSVAAGFALLGLIGSGEFISSLPHTYCSLASLFQHLL